MWLLTVPHLSSSTSASNVVCSKAIFHGKMDGPMGKILVWGSLQWMCNTREKVPNGLPQKWTRATLQQSQYDWAISQLHKPWHHVTDLEEHGRRRGEASHVYVGERLHHVALSASHIAQPRSSELIVQRTPERWYRHTNGNYKIHHSKHSVTKNLKSFTNSHFPAIWIMLVQTSSNICKSFFFWEQSCDSEFRYSFSFMIFSLHWEICNSVNFNIIYVKHLHIPLFLLCFFPTSNFIN